MIRINIVANLLMLLFLNLFQVQQYLEVSLIILTILLTLVNLFKKIMEIKKNENSQSKS